MINKLIFNKLSKLIVSFLMIFSMFIIPTKATSVEEEYFSREEHMIEILDEYFSNKVEYLFYDSNNNLVNDRILDLKENYFYDKISTIKSIIPFVDTTIKIEDINQNAREAVPGGGGSAYETKKLTCTKSYYDYAYVQFTFTGRIKLGKYVEWIDLNVADPSYTKKIYPKYESPYNNFLVKFDQYKACYGCTPSCSVYAYKVQYKVTLFIATINSPTIRNDELEVIHCPIYARDYKWFNTHVEYYNGL